ncbi:hypothetical protein NPIL_23071, partial [Nephila pilipes]
NLAPWQKLTAIKAYIHTKADLIVQNSHTKKKDVIPLDKTIIADVKNILNLPISANTNLIHLSCNNGRAALLQFHMLLDIHAMSQAWMFMLSYHKQK